MNKPGNSNRNRVLDSLLFTSDTVALYGPDGNRVADLAPGVALSSSRFVSEVENLKLVPGVYVAPQIGKAVLVSGGRGLEEATLDGIYSPVTCA